MERVALVRPFSWEVLYPEVQAKRGADARSLNAPGDISFSVAPTWHNALAADGRPFFVSGGLLSLWNGRTARYDR